MNPYFAPQPNRFDICSYLKEIANTLQYCLRINLQIDAVTMSKSEDSDFWEQLEEYCYDRLSSFILGRSGWYSFFGENGGNLVHEDRPTNLYQLKRYREEWKRLFFEDALTEILIYLRDLLSVNGLTNYLALPFSHVLDDNAPNKQIYHNRIIGLDRQLEYETAKMEIIDGRIELNINKSKIQSKHTSSQCSGYGRMCQEINEDISAFSPKAPELINVVECLEAKKQKKQIPAGRVDLAAYYVSHKKEIKILCDIYSREISDAELHDAMLRLQDEISGNELNNVDRLYLYTCIERTFHISAILHLYDRIKSINNYDLLQDAQAFSLNSCLSLPLCFSGKLLIDMALDSIERVPIDGGFFENIIDIKTVASYVVNTRDPYSLPEWINQYKSMMYYLSDFAFPVFRSCFFVMFFQAMEQRIGAVRSEKRADNSASINDVGNNCDLQILMYNSIRDYLNQGGYERLICPDDTKIPNLSKFLDTKDQPSKIGNYDGLVSFFKNMMTSYRKIEDKRPQGPFITLKYLDELSNSQPLHNTLYEENSQDKHMPASIANHLNLYILDAGHLTIDLQYKKRV